MDWNDIMLRRKSTQPILAMQLHGHKLEVLKCNALLQFAVGNGEPVLLSERMLNFKKTKSNVALMQMKFK